MVHSKQLLRKFAKKDGRLLDWVRNSGYPITRQGRAMIDRHTVMTWEAGFGTLLGEPMATAQFEPPLRLPSGRLVDRVTITVLGGLALDKANDRIANAEFASGLEVDLSDDVHTGSVYTLNDDETWQVQRFNREMCAGANSFGRFADAELNFGDLLEVQLLTADVLDNIVTESP